MPKQKKVKVWNRLVKQLLSITVSGTIGSGAGANIYFGDRNSDADFFHRFTVAPEIQFGKWINPYLGTRIKGAGLTNLHTFNDNATIMSRNRYASVQADLMWSMTDYFMKYNSKRVYSFVPYVGFGWAFGWDYTNQPAYAGGHTRVNGMTLNAGNLIRSRVAVTTIFWELLRLV